MHDVQIQTMQLQEKCMGEYWYNKDMHCKINDVPIDVSVRYYLFEPTGGDLLYDTPPSVVLEDIVLKVNKENYIFTRFDICSAADDIFHPADINEDIKLPSLNTDDIKNLYQNVQLLLREQRKKRENDVLEKILKKLQTHLAYIITQLDNGMHYA